MEKFGGNHRKRKMPGTPTFFSSLRTAGDLQFSEEIHIQLLPELHSTRAPNWVSTWWNWPAGPASTVPDKVHFIMGLISPMQLVQHFPLRSPGSSTFGRLCPIRHDTSLSFTFQAIFLIEIDLILNQFEASWVPSESNQVRPRGAQKQHTRHNGVKKPSMAGCD